MQRESAVASATSNVWLGYRSVSYLTDVFFYELGELSSQVEPLISMVVLNKSNVPTAFFSKSSVETEKQF